MSNRTKEYIVYDMKTDFPVCIGSLVECSLKTRVPKNTLKTNTTRYFNGERVSCRYVLYDLDKLINGGYLEEGDNGEQLCQN